MFFNFQVTRDAIGLHDFWVEGVLILFKKTYFLQLNDTKTSTGAVQSRTDINGFGAVYDRWWQPSPDYRPARSLYFCFPQQGKSLSKLVVELKTLIL